LAALDGQRVYKPSGLRVRALSSAADATEAQIFQIVHKSPNISSTSPQQSKSSNLSSNSPQKSKYTKKVHKSPKIGTNSPQKFK